MSTPRSELRGPDAHRRSAADPSASIDAALVDAAAPGVPDSVHRLLVAAVTVFAERGYHAASTRDVARVAKLGPSTLYAHFRSKEELLFQVCALGHRLVLASISDLDQHGDAQQQLRDLVQRLTFWYACNPMLGWVSHYELTELEPTHRIEVAKLRRQTTAAVRRVIAEGLRSGQFAECDEETATAMITSLAVDVARWFHVGVQHTPASLAAGYADLAVQMLAGR